MTRFRRALLAAAAALAPAAAATAVPLADRPLVIAHRGASQYLPEHTMEAYRLAIRMGADFVEPDLFTTQDGVAVARHDRSLNATTNAVAFAAANPAFFAKGTPGSGTTRNYNIDNLSLADIRQLGAVSRGTAGYARPETSPFYEATDVFGIPTFAEVLAELHALHQATGRVVGVYPEVKTVGTGLTAYNQQTADAMLADLTDPRWGGLFDGSRNNVFLQSFDQAVIRYLDTRTVLPLVFLTGVCPTAAQLDTVNDFADGIGVSANNATQACIDRTHAAGLLIHVYTLSNVAPELHETFYRRGVDGIFSNAPDTARAARDLVFPVPVPASLALFGLALAGLVAARRRRA